METTSEVLNYPRHSIPATEKTDEWGRAYAKAAWNDWSVGFPHSVFYNNGGNYEKFRLYAQGKQPTDQYKRYMGVDTQTNVTWMNIDWSVRPIVSRYRDRAIARLMKDEHGVVATPIDPMSKSKLEGYFNGLKVKIAMRQLMEQQHPELAGHPLLSTQPGEPLDMEELQMRIDFGEQFLRSRDAEQAIQLAFYENNDRQFRRSLFEDLFDLGVAGYKEWLGDNNKPKFRKVNPECVVTNYCRQGDFSDLVHAGEVIDVPIHDLACLYDEQGGKVFTEQQLHEMATYASGRFGNPRYMGRDSSFFKGYDKFKVKVLDMEFYSWNDYYYNEWTNSKGNPEYEPKEKEQVGNRRYKKKCIKVVYKIKWIVGMDYSYDFGLLDDMKRTVDAKKKAETSLSYKFFAYNFYEMRAQGMMERMVPLLDAYQMTMLKIQNFENRAVPSGWWIDFDALENVSLNKGGENMTPMELLDMFYATGVLVGRSSDLAGNSQNYKPVIPIANSAAADLQMFYQSLEWITGQLERTIGYNPVTTGEPQPKMLTSGYETAENSTDDALQAVGAAETWLIEKLANDVMIRTQQGLRKGSVEGWGPSLNRNTLEFIKIDPEMSLVDYGIMLEEKSTEEQKAFLLQSVQTDIAQGLLDSGDAAYIINVFNVKQAQEILNYRVKKARQQAQQNEIQKITATTDQQKQSAMMTAQMDMQKQQQQNQFELAKMEREHSFQLQMKQIELSIKDKMNTDQVHGKIATQVIANEGKEQAAAE